MSYLNYKDFEIENGYIYVIKVLGYYKIGKTKNPEKRFGEYTMLMEEPQVVLLDYVSDYHRLELDLHKIYEHKRTRGEWFKLSEKDIKNIRFMLSCYHVETDKEQMDNLIKYLSETLQLDIGWGKDKCNKYYICWFLSKDRESYAPLVPVNDCKNVKEVQIKVLQYLSKKEKLQNLVNIQTKL